MALKAFVAMSGGVDSAVCALLMKEQGYDVVGVNLILNKYNDSEQAQKVAEKLKIDFVRLDYSADFEECVISDFTRSYIDGRTPNPCIVCNKKLKFGRLFADMKRLGGDVLATGHYARLSWDSRLSEPRLCRASDESKDQSYVLYSLPAEILRDIRFPLGELTKSQVRELAQKAGFENSNKPESQDICFIPDGDYAAYIRNRCGVCDKTGNFIDTNGKILGTHKGITNYTVGQRRGLGIAAEAPLYVLAKNPADNTVTLGFENELMGSSFRVENINALCPSVFYSGACCTVRTRYHQKETACTVKTDGKSAQISTDNPIRRPAPGQSAVFYSGDTVIAGGVIV